MPIPENVENLQRVSAKSTIYQVVCDWIITGVLKPGEKIIDSELAKRFNVSRTPVREAIQILEGQKLVYVVPGRATVVADIDPADIEKCYRTLAELQALAAELACGSLTEQELEQLKHLFGQLRPEFKEYVLKELQNLLELQDKADAYRRTK